MAGKRVPWYSFTPRHVWAGRLHRTIFGAPKRTDQAHHERLNVLSGLAVFSADAISSVAYATEEILLVLAAAGAAASAYSLSVGLAIVALVFIVSASYTQTIRAYPSGGGSYIVSKDNLGTSPGLVAGAALLVDYVLTVAVSTASGIAAITSAFPRLQGHEVALSLAAIVFIAWVNLRGVRESGIFFAVPTYGFIAAMFTMIGVGAFKALTGDWNPVVPLTTGFGYTSGQFTGLLNGVTLFMLLRAFASGCTALTGIEAVSNGVQAFRAPESTNAIKTMKWGRNILYSMFAGITLLAFGYSHRIAAVHGGETVLSQLARAIFGGGPVYYIAQIMTALILLLAANTAYADFPRLASLIASDGFLPRKLANRGNTLVFNGGVYVLAFLAAVLIVAFQGSVHLLIPLYAVGVFLAFTMSQTGMVVHWFKVSKQAGEKLSSHAWSIFINTLGALLSGVALVVIAITKFTHGAWIVCIVIPLLVSYFYYVHNYYVRFRDRVEALHQEHLPIDDARKVRTVLTIGGLTAVIDHAMKVAHRMSKDITAVYVATDPELGQKIARKWDVKRHGGVKLTVLDSPYRNVVPPLRKYLDEQLEKDPDTLLNVLLPVIVTNDPFDTYLHNGTSDQILRELRYSEGILITVIPFYVDMHPEAESAVASYPPAGND
ncbi:MAG TPA: APC family permease [Symbiobacteriaceae bacterium]|nr:APC family permease [Symbiobacteriaceae bacterium]